MPTLYYLSWEPNPKLSHGSWSWKPLTTEGSSVKHISDITEVINLFPKCSTAEFSEDRDGKK